MSAFQIRGADCKQVGDRVGHHRRGIAAGYEVMDGNTSDRTTLLGFLHKIEATYWQPFVLLCGLLWRWTGLREDVMASRFFFPLAFSSYQRGPLTALQRYFAVMCQFWRYRRMTNPVEARFAHMELRLTDNFEAAGQADHYFYQDTWFARKMFSERPSHHVDVGSLLGSIGVISQFVPITYIDLRPLRISLPGLTFTRGSLMALPFASATVESLSSLHVVEHCGLGRYGDDLDASGTAKACKEMLRVLKPGASLYVAVPTAAQSTTCFNAHRIFAPDSFLEFFRGIEVIEESYVTADGMCARNEYNALGLPFSVGCFHLRKL